MTDKDGEMLTYARKIRNYCKGRSCDSCVFLRNDNGDDMCPLEDSGAPSSWVIPNKTKAE